jgi:hypothetical protein
MKQILMEIKPGASMPEDVAPPQRLKKSHPEPHSFSAGWGGGFCEF